ncbi:MAG: prepilin-type N-terminal cleavage/methylation domain-containing protein, partial [Tepidisphaeraceae bacterium]
MLPAAFTLVELLVVIGIIAVLISILLPTLSSARKQAEKLKCLSNLRQIGIGFQMYQQAHKGMMPVLRQDLPDYNGVISNGANVYWQDFIMPYVSKFGKTGRSEGAASLQTFETARNSVMWGCPTWAGWPGQDAYTFEFGVSRFENGYTYNIYPTSRADGPRTAMEMPLTNEWQMRWAGVYEGRHNKINQWTRPADRMLLVDGNLWLLNFLCTPVPFSNQYITRKSNDQAGSSNADRYRHGKIGKIVGSGVNATVDQKSSRVGY